MLELRREASILRHDGPPVAQHFDVAFAEVLRSRANFEPFVPHGALDYFWKLGPSFFLPPDNETTSMVSVSGE